MSKKKSTTYENLYTKQLEEAVFDQKTYDTQRQEAKQKVIAEKVRHKGLVRLFMFLAALALAVIAYRLLS